ncbi:hypothetical protein [Pseudomonas psychrophila]|uniref:hypothetical protein n=1 Tax=Pseudomonas psychrophila TaxID=122355 RepID=UPI0003571C19|nr:hypothetical protein [Pseudomonas psychrophila]EPJ92146.1 hypothetical protein CF149_19316 [Pseudomonas psychrophila]
MQNTIPLTRDHKVILAEASVAFPGEQLNEIVQRAFIDLPVNKEQSKFYELRRFDTPLAFDAILKLQNTGSARRYIEVNGEEFSEVLHIEVTLLDLIMHTISLLLDVLFRALGGSLRSTSIRSTEPPTVAPHPQKYVPSWKSGLRIEHDDYGYTP